MEFGVGEQERVGPRSERVKVDHKDSRPVSRDVHIQDVCREPETESVSGL